MAERGRFNCSDRSKQADPRSLDAFLCNFFLCRRYEKKVWRRGIERKRKSEGERKKPVGGAEKGIRREKKNRKRMNLADCRTTGRKGKKMLRGFVVFHVFDLLFPTFYTGSLDASTKAQQMLEFLAMEATKPNQSEAAKLHFFFSLSLSLLLPFIHSFSSHNRLYNLIGSDSYEKMEKNKYINK